MIKFLNPKRYYEKARILWYLRTQDQTELRQQEDAKFADIGVTIENAETKLNSVLQPILDRPFDRQRDSIHWLVFAALSLTRQPARILEIGTYDGGFTRILAALFPDAEILTVDLPPDDPILRTTYNRETDDAYQAFTRKQEANTAAPNITFCKLNSFFLPGIVDEPFDLLWVDGGHLYPEVAWDLCNAYHLCTPGGAFLCDDVILDSRAASAYASAESADVIAYIEARTEARVTHYLKRLNPFHNAFPISRKYVTMIQKPSDPTP